jgi:hypothetical protein
MVWFRRPHTCLEDGLQDGGERRLRVDEVVVELELDVEADAAVDALERLAQRAQRVLRPHLPPEDPPVLELPEQRLPSLMRTIRQSQCSTEVSSNEHC